MISFGMNDEQKAAREALRDFALKAMRSQARDCDEGHEVSDAFLNQAWELGLSMAQIPEEYGGVGTPRSPITNAIILEELGYGDVPLAVAALAPSLFVNALIDHGTEEQKKTYLPPFCEEKYRAASLALIEPGACFDAAKLKTTAKQEGGEFVLSGEKTLVPMGAKAQHFLVIASNGDRRDAFIVPRDAAGLSVTEVEKNLGLNATYMAGLKLENVRVPGGAQLGGDAGCDVQGLINNSRVALAALLVGLSRGVLEYCIPYAREREAFDEPIAKKQAIAFMLADMHIEVEATRWLVWKAASELEQGASANASAEQAWAYAAEKCVWVADNGIQVLGGHGFIREHPVEMWFRNARTLSVLEGAAAI